jgi:hypothetical protein
MANEARVRAQPQHGRRNLLGRAQAADQLLRDHRFPAFAGAATEPLDHPGVDDPGQTALTRLFDDA